MYQGSLQVSFNIYNTCQVTPVVVAVTVVYMAPCPTPDTSNLEALALVPNPARQRPTHGGQEFPLHVDNPWIPWMVDSQQRSTKYEGFSVDRHWVVLHGPTEMQRRLQR